MQRRHKTTEDATAQYKKRDLIERQNHKKNQGRQKTQERHKDHIVWQKERNLLSEPLACIVAYESKK